MIVEKNRSVDFRDPAYSLNLKNKSEKKCEISNSFGLLRGI